MSRLPIVKLGNDTWDNARRAVWYCPFCHYEPPDRDWNEWERNASKLVLYPRIWRPRQVVVFSECPKCFEHSWVHYDAEMIVENLYEEFPAYWRTTVAALTKEPLWIEQNSR